MAEQRVVKVSLEIDATPEAVFQAIINPLDLTYWFCHEAWTEPRVGGDFQVRWRNGWWARGVYQMVERPRRVELNWQGKDEPGETTLAFEIEALDKGSRVTVFHSGYGDDAVWDKAVVEAESSWPQALENLASVLTTGIDLRTASRPVLGIVPEELSVERAAQEGISIDSGIYLANVLEGGGAAEAGLQQGDVITSIGGMAVSDWPSLTTTLASWRAGDRVQVRYVRGRERAAAVIELRPRPMPEVPPDLQSVIDQVRESQASLLGDLRAALAGLSEEEAERKTATDKWSIKEILAHLSLSERSTQRRFADVICGSTTGQFGGNPTTVPEALAMTLVAAPTVPSLLQRLEQDMGETLALFAALRPEVVEMRARYYAIAGSLLVDYHFQDHINQIRATAGD